MEALGGLRIRPIRDHTQHQPGNVLLFGHLRHGGTLHFHGLQIGQGIAQGCDDSGITDELITGSDQSWLGAAESLECSGGVALFKGVQGPLNCGSNTARFSGGTTNRGRIGRTSRSG